MRALAGLCALSLSALAAFGCSSSDSNTSGSGGTGGDGGAGGAGGGGACTVPTEKNSLSLLSGAMCDPALPMAGTIVLEGAFAPVAGGFQVASAQETAEILQAEPAIPAGTLVRLTYGCSNGFYGDAGAFVQIENVASIDGAANPTEDGTRLWYFITAGGEAGIPDQFPFSVDFEQACMDGTIEDGFKAPQSMTLSDPEFSVTVEPGAEEPFTVPSGPHAGAYTAKNVNVTFIGFQGGDATSNVNFTVTRAD